MEDGQLYGVNHESAAKQRLQTKRKSSWRWSWALRFWPPLLNHLALEYSESLFTTWLKLSNLVVLLGCFSMCRIKAPKGNPTIGFLSWHYEWLIWEQILSMPLTRKFFSFSLPSRWRLISHYCHRRHFPTVRISSSSLQNYLSWYLPCNPSQWRYQNWTKDDVSLISMHRLYCQLKLILIFTWFVSDNFLILYEQSLKIWISCPIQ